MKTELPVDPVALREEVKSKYRDVARNPHGEHHFHTGRPLARRLGYDQWLAASMPAVAIESFAGQIRGEVELGAIIEGLRAAAVQTVHPSGVQCWLRGAPGPGGTPALGLDPPA